MIHWNPIVLNGTDQKAKTELVLDDTQHEVYNGTRQFLDGTEHEATMEQDIFRRH